MSWRERLGAGGPLIRARVVAVVAALVILWFVVLTWWSQYASEPDAMPALISISVAALAVTALWLASLRWVRLRRALLPIDVGVLVAALVLVVGHRGFHFAFFDSETGSLALLSGAVIAAVVAFIAPLFEGVRHGGRWIAGIVVVLALGAIALPDLYGVAGEPDDFYGGAPPEGYWEVGVANLVTADGRMRISKNADRYQVTPLGAGYSSDPWAQYGTPSAIPLDSEADDPAAAAGAPPSAVGGSPPPGVTSGPGASAQPPLVVLTDAAGTLELRVKREFVEGLGQVQLEVRRGSCAASPPPAAAQRVDMWQAGASGAIVRRLPLTLDQLKPTDELVLLVGSGRPLAPVRCLDMLSRSALALAKDGGVEFAKQCADVLEPPVTSHDEITREALGDAECADQLERLAERGRKVVTS